MAYSPCDVLRGQPHDTDLRHRVRVSQLSNGLDNYGNLTLLWKLRGRTGAEGTYVLNRQSDGSYLSAALATADRIPRTGGLVDMNIRTGSTAQEFLFLTAATDELSTLADLAFEPLEMFEMIDTQWTAVRGAGDNVWFSTGWNISNLLQGGAQLFGMLFFEFRVPGRTPWISSRPFWIRDLLRLTRLSNPDGAGRGVSDHANLNRKRLVEIVSNGAPSLRGSNGVANCIWAVLEGNDEVDIGVWDDGTLNLVFDHVASWVAGSKLKLHYVPGTPVV